MPKCSFCNKSIEKGTGKMYVKTSGKIFYFCSNKCEKSLIEFKKNPLKTRWTTKFHEEKNKHNEKQAEQK